MPNNSSDFQGPPKRHQSTAKSWIEHLSTSNQPSANENNNIFELKAFQQQTKNKTVNIFSNFRFFFKSILGMNVLHQFKWFSN